MFTPQQLTKCYLNGEWRGAKNGSESPVDNPYTQQIIGNVPSLSADEVSEVIADAQAAFLKWRDLTSLDRSRKLKAIANLCLTHQEDLARLLTQEQGKPHSQARAEIAYGASYFEWFGEEARRTYGDIIPSPAKERRILVLKEPVGICAAITPWNFPHAMIARKAAAAMAAGCSFIVKPAPETPFSALAIAKLCELAEVPAGVFNVVTGEAEEIGRVLTDSALVRKISFTGSTEVGKLLMKQSADTVKRLTLELGGNAPFIVFDDADLDLAVKDGIHAKFRNSGQTCICSNRLLLQKGIAQKFVEKFIEATKSLKIGNGADEATEIGPLINDAAKEKVNALLDEAIKGGAKLEFGSIEKGKSLLMPPKILSGITSKMKIWKEEIFGPVAACSTFGDEQEAIALANDTQYGLAAYFYTRDVARAFKLAEKLEYGMVGVNTTSISAPEGPFGGIKQSGFGREGSKYGIEEYLSTKYVALGVG